jgi:hypothetical protein
MKMPENMMQETLDALRQIVEEVYQSGKDAAVCVIRSEPEIVEQIRKAFEETLSPPQRKKNSNRDYIIWEVQTRWRQWQVCWQIAQDQITDMPLPQPQAPSHKPDGQPDLP